MGVREGTLLSSLKTGPIAYFRNTTLHLYCIPLYFVYLQLILVVLFTIFYDVSPRLLRLPQCRRLLHRRKRRRDLGQSSLKNKTYSLRSLVLETARAA